MDFSHLKHVKNVFSWVADKQEKKGVKKYGKALNPFDHYNWLSMAKEELVDGFKYLEAEQVKRDYVADKLIIIANKIDDQTAGEEILQIVGLLKGDECA